MNTKMEKLAALKKRKEDLLQMGGATAIEKQHSRNKLTARERIHSLFDSDTFMEIDVFVKHRCGFFGMGKREIPADAVVSGFGKIGGRDVFMAAEDYTTFAGTFGEMHGKKFCKVLDFAAEAGAPFVQIIDSGGARLQEGQDSSEVYAQVFRRHILYSGVVPQISLLMGPCGGGAAYGPALTDFIIMTEGTAHMYMGGPAFVRTMLGEEKREEDLGGARVHSQITGLCDLVAENDDRAISLTRELLGFLPSNNRQMPPVLQERDDPNRKNIGILDFIPDSSKAAFDMRKIITEVVDNHYIFEMKPNYARNMITAFARLDGKTVGILANQSLFKGGTIDVHAANKHSRFLRFCDCFNIPVIHFQDSPGVMIGQDEEYRGIIKIGSKMLHAATEATVPKITLIVRHSYAGAQLCMCNKPMGADFVFAWPTAEVALVGPETAASVIYAKELAGAQDPEKTKSEKLEEYSKLWINPYLAAERGYIDDIIDPEETRRVLIRSLEVLKDKKDERPWKKHGNIQM